MVTTEYKSLKSRNVHLFCFLMYLKHLELCLAYSHNKYFWNDWLNRPLLFLAGFPNPLLWWYSSFLIFLFLYNQPCWLSKNFWSKFCIFVFHFLPPAVSATWKVLSILDSLLSPICLQDYLKLHPCQWMLIEFNRPPNFQKVLQLPCIPPLIKEHMQPPPCHTLTHTHSHKHTILKALWETASGILRP